MDMPVEGEKKTKQKKSLFKLSPATEDTERKGRDESKKTHHPSFA